MPNRANDHQTEGDARRSSYSVFVWGSSWLPVAICAAGCMLTLILVAYVYRSAQAKDEIRFHNRVQRTVDYFGARLDQNFAFLRAWAGSIAANPRSTSAVQQRYLQSQALDRRLPALRYLVHLEGRDANVASATQSWWQGAFIHPMTLEKEAVEVLHSVPEFDHVLNEARKLDQCVVWLAPRHPVWPGEDSWGLLLWQAIPVTDHDAPGAANRAQGGLLAVLDGQRLLSGVFGPGEMQGIGFALSMVTDSTNGPAICRSHGEGGVQAWPALQTNVSCSLGGRKWLFAFNTLPEFRRDSAHGAEWIVLLLGLAASTGLYLVTRHLVAANAASARLAGELRDLSTRLESAREEERARVARDLHDQMGQSLAALKLDLYWFVRHLPDGPEEWRRRVLEMGGVLDHLIEETRRLVSELRPPLLDDVGFAASLCWQAREVSRRSGLEVDCSGVMEDLRLPHEAQPTLYRIFQEILTNVVRHASATKVTVVLRAEGGNVLLQVEDNGCGFDVTQVDRTRSFGLLGMRERCASLGAHLKIDSTPGRGTCVRIHIPAK